LSSILKNFFGKEQADDGTAKIAKLNILSKKSMDILILYDLRRQMVEYSLVPIDSDSF